VFGIEPDVMHPAIKHNGAAGRNGVLVRNGDAAKAAFSVVLTLPLGMVFITCGDCIGALEAGLSTGKSLNMAVIFLLKVDLKINHSLLCSGFVISLVPYAMEDAHVHENCEHEMHGSGISDGLSASCNKNWQLQMHFHRSSMEF